MIVTCVHIKVIPEKIQEFKAITVYNHNQTSLEKGNLRFDFLQDASDPTKFLLYEVFESDEAILAHKNTLHYIKWRDTVADWMAEPRKGIRYEVVEPKNSEAW